jgi:hypothetical protein
MFTAKTMMSPAKSNNIVVTRRIAFEAYLNYLLSLHPVPADVVAFLELDTTSLATTVSEAAAAAGAGAGVGVGSVASSPRSNSNNSPDKKGSASPTKTSENLASRTSRRTLPALAEDDKDNKENKDKETGRPGGEQFSPPKKSEGTALGVQEEPKARTISELLEAAAEGEELFQPVASPEGCTMFVVLTAAAYAIIHAVFMFLGNLMVGNVSFSIGYQELFNQFLFFVPGLNDAEFVLFVVTGGMFTRLFASIRNGYRTARFGMEVLIGVAILQLFMHKILAHVATYALNKSIRTESGAFSFEFGYISLHLGIESSELVVHNFVW